MYDAWAIIDSVARPYLIGNSVSDFFRPFEGFVTNISKTEAQEMALSYATFRIIKHRFKNSPGFSEIEEISNKLMIDLNYSVEFERSNYASGDPAALGNYIAETWIAFGLQDGSNELGKYENRFYYPVNPPLVTNFAGNSALDDPNRWQPLALETFIDQSGNIIQTSTPEFLSPEWGDVTPFFFKRKPTNQKGKKRK